MKTNQTILAIYFFILFLFPYSNALGDVKLPQVISSGMVFQRDAEIKVWGWADKGESIKVSFNNISRSTKGSKEGKWSVIFQAMKEGGPYELIVKGKKNTITLENILIGDVWICSGQSNMQWGIGRSDNAEEEIKNANYPGIRLITIPRVIQKGLSEDVPETAWKTCSPENIPDFSAAGYFFGRKIHAETGVPIGLISTNWGGTGIETWTSADCLSTFPEYIEKLELLNAYLKEDKDRAETIKPNDLPSLLFNSMIYPLLNLRVKGAIWYQGEQNASKAYLYRELSPNMINCWRKYWNQPDMPFFLVQLANFRAPVTEPGESAWAELREAQLMTLSVPNTGMAVTIDIGDANDIHPRNKQDVGLRLALSAMEVAYKKDITGMGPIYKSMEVSGDKAILTFDYIGNGLMAKDKYGYLKGFSIAAADKKFYWAKAWIENNKVIVTSPSVSIPVSVRYGWADNPDDVNLYNSEGLPASPFRTDNWDGITK